MDSIYVTKPSMPSFDEYCDEIKDIWKTRVLTNAGNKLHEFEKQLESFLECSDVVLFSNGHSALENVLSAMGFSEGGEVITTPFTFASTTNAIVRNGLVPVFCDIDYEDYTIDVSRIEGLINENTVAILPVHVYGNICHVEQIQEIARNHNLKVIYDAAHAFSVKYKGISTASFGDATMFSFHATKVFNTIEGGAVCTNDPSLITKLNQLKNFGISSSGDVLLVGENAKMNEFQAAMGLCNLRHITEEISKRKNVAMRYFERLQDTQGIKLSYPQTNVQPNYAYFPVLFDGYSKNRDEVFQKLADKNIFARKYFYPLTNCYSCYQNLNSIRDYSTPVAEYIAERVLTLPLYADLSIKEVDRICDIILE